MDVGRPKERLVLLIEVSDTNESAKHGSVACWLAQLLRFEWQFTDLNGSY